MLLRQHPTEDERGVFAVMYLHVIKFQPRMSSPNDRKLYAFEAKGRYGVLLPFMGQLSCAAQTGRTHELHPTASSHD